MLPGRRRITTPAIRRPRVPFQGSRWEAARRFSSRCCIRNCSIMSACFLRRWAADAGAANYASGGALTPAWAKQFKLFLIACGSEDTLVGPSVVAFKAALKQNSVPFTDIVTPGTHSYTVWKRKPGRVRSAAVPVNEFRFKQARHRANIAARLDRAPVATA